MISLIKFLKFRLPKWKNEDYWRWCSSQRRDGWEWHHLLGRKYSDLFVVMIPSEVHKGIHSSKGYDKDGQWSFEELFLQSINNIARFIDEQTN